MNWDQLEEGYLDLNPSARAVFDILAPVSNGFRTPIYELGHETTPTPEQVWKLAEELSRAAINAMRYLKVPP